MKLSNRRCAQLGLMSALMVLTMSVTTLLVIPNNSRPVQVADIGTVAPDFELPDANGQSVSLSELRGDVVVLFFSSLRNPASGKYDDRVTRVAQSYDNDPRVKFFAIDVGNGEHVDPLYLKLDNRVAGRGYPTLLDEKAYVAARYSATVTPMLVIIDPHGVVKYRGPFDNNADVAFASHSYLVEALHDVLESATVTVANR